MRLENISKVHLKPIVQNTMTELVAERLVDLLSSGTLKPGDKLPPERDLATQLNVGRTTVREALKLLTLSGLLEARRGDGTYVRHEFGSFLLRQIEWPVLLSAHQIDMVLEVRQPLEVQAVRMAAERATDKEIERIARFREALEIGGRDIERETELDLDFHHAVAAAAHNDLLSHLMLSLNSILRQYIELSNQMTDRLETTVAEHQEIYDAIVAQDPDQAAQAMIEHLQISKSLIMKAFDRETEAE
jgi:GntR family transcriptional repressor for pyruvate dehydrogenase complex